MKRSAYFLAIYNIANGEMFKKYQDLAIPMLKKYGCEVLTLGDVIVDNIVEGEPFEMAVILKFPSATDAKNWYRSPQYQEILPIRLNSVSDARGTIVEGIAVDPTKTLENYHAAAKYIEEDGISGFESAAKVAGLEIAYALIIAHLRISAGSTKSYPAAPDIQETVNEILKKEKLLPA